MSVRQAQLEISSPEFTEWQAFYQLEPFGDLVADQRHGIAVATMVNLQRDPKTRPEPYEPQDFIHWRESEQQDVDDEPELIDDPVAHSNLIRAAMFGIRPKQVDET